MDVRELKPRRGYLLVEPARERAKVGDIYVPQQSLPKLPQIGWVIRIGELREEIAEGDVVIFPLLSTIIPQTYDRALWIDFSDGQEFYGPPDLEPVVKVFLEDAKPEESMTITSFDGSTWEFKVEEVLEFQIIERESYKYAELEQFPGYILWEGSQMYYLIHEDEILCTFEV